MGRTDLHRLYADAERRILNPVHRELEPKRGDRGFAAMRVRRIDPNSRTVRAVFSTENIDRHGEMIDPAAFRNTIDQFMKNPVLVANHTYAGPGGEPGVIGTIEDLRITPTGLEGAAKFMHDDPLADSWWKRFEQRAVRAFSIGFIANAWEMRSVKDEDGRKRRLRAFTDVELIEISAVSIPANRESLAQNGLGLLPAESEPSRERGGLSNRRLNKLLQRSVPAALQREARSMFNLDAADLRTFIQDVVEQAVEETLVQTGHSIGNDYYVGDRHSSLARTSEPQRGKTHGPSGGDDSIFVDEGEPKSTDDVSRLFGG